MTNKYIVGAFKTGSAITCLLVLILLSSLSFAQQLTGTLTGTVADSAGAVVPNAKITMKNEASGDIRTSVSNGAGYFSITAIQPGTYTVSIEAPGFKTWQRTGIAFSQGDNHTLSNVKLEVGNVSETVEIKAGADVVIPDNAEVSTTLNTELIQDTPIAGRDAGELLKVMPGMAFTNGISQGIPSGFNTQTVGTNNGPVGAFSANGTQPNGAMAFMLDGANLVDPGNAGTQIANINQDMVSEVKVLMSSYSAEYAKGPVIFQAFSKSGGNQFHGEGYFYARNNVFNSWDAYTKTQFLSDIGQYPALKNQFFNNLHPDARYYYPGGNIGGPIPFLNHGKQKVFFWGGFEYMVQHPAAAPVNYNVPTQEQLSGDFSETTINGLPGTTPVSGCGNNATLFTCLSSGAVWQYAYSIPYGLPGGGTQLAQSNYDLNVGGIAKLMPKANITPAASNGWSNYQYVNTSPQNRWEATGKVDYSISDNTKLSVSYTRQIETDQHPIGVWWTPPWTLPYPSNVIAATTSQEVMANFTHVFSPTTTNEAVFTLARYINPSTLANKTAVSRKALGFGVQGLFGHTTDQIPNFEGPWGGAFPNIEEFSFEGSFNGGGSFGGLKKDPSIYDNFTKVVGSHTLKAGFYWDTSENIQSAGGLGPGDNGTFNLGWGPNSSGNLVADFLLGRTGNYQQVSAFPTNDLKFHQWSIYAQDSFKANRQLTLNYGLRFDHVGQWYGTSQGFQVFDPSTYVNNVYTGTPGNGSIATFAPGNTGLLWHQNTPSIPLSGMPSPLFYYEPRVGLAYDIFGNGKTVLRAGFAVFHYQISTQVADAATGPEGTFTFQTVGTQNGYADINSGQPGFVPPPSQTQNGATVFGLLRGDNKTPLTMDYNVTISQALPWRSVFEVSYVGNKSQNEWVDGNNGKVSDLNNVPYGGFFLPDPSAATPGPGGADAIPGVNNNYGLLLSPNAPSCKSSTPFNNQPLVCASVPNYKLTFNANDWRPMNAYQDVYLLYHGSYANYNSLQMSWQKQSGPVTFLTNYTFSKVLGIRDGQTSNGAGNGTVMDPFNLKNNYGPLAYDHTHIFNLSASWNMPKFIHGHHFLEGAVNGWQLSTYTTYQSGAELQSNVVNLNAAYASGLTMPTNALPDLPDNSIRLPNGLAATNVSTQTWLGISPDNSGFNLMPTLTCNPAKGLKSGQSFNPNCFGMPAYGQQGPFLWPYMRVPAFFDSDLGIYKNFNITERQKIQFRVQATNWLNHPLGQFNLANNNDVKLSFQNNTQTFIASGRNGSAGDECGYATSPGNGIGGTAVAGGCMVPTVAISPTNTNPLTTGKPAFKTGSRTLLFSVKYFF